MNDNNDFDFDFEISEKLIQQYRGKAAILLARASTTRQTVSVPDQLKHMRRFAQRLDITVVGEVANAGLSGSKSWARDDIDEILRRKRQGEAFELVIVYDNHRLTRGGVMNGYVIRHQLNSCGLELLFSSEAQYEGIAGDIDTTVKLAAAQMQSQSIAKTASRGYQSAVEQGRALPFPIPPFGTDKLILAPDGQPRHILHYLPDRSLQLLDPETRAVLEHFGTEADATQRSRYTKQRMDKVELVSGDPEQVRVVHQVFRWKFEEGVGGPTIAGRLNEQGVPSPRGGKWSQRAISKMLSDAAYLGFAVGNRTSRAIYYRRHKHGPKLVEQDPKVKAGQAAPAGEYRARADWVIVDQPRMKEFLPADIRVAAQAHIDAKWQRCEQPYTAKPKRDRYGQSPYFLKGILCARHTGQPMSGKKLGSSGKRYYYPSRAMVYPKSDRSKHKYVPADPVEQVIAQVLFKVLHAAPNMKERLLDSARQAMQPEADLAQQRQQLQRKQTKLTQQFDLITDNIDTYGQAKAKELLQRNREKLDDVERQLRSLDTRAPVDEKTLTQQVERLLERMHDTAQALLEEAPRPHVNKLLRLFVANATVDLETRHLDLTLRVPRELLSDPTLLDNDRSPDGPLACQRSIRASSPDSLPLLEYRILWLGDEGALYVGFGRYFSDQCSGEAA